MSLIEDARKELGQLFIMGFNGLELPDDTSAFIAQAEIGGVIFFSPNYENPGLLAELSNQIQGCRTELPLWISVDQEGGKVQRFKKGFTKIPEAAAIAAADSPKLAFDIAEVIAKELKAVGVNLNFSPVADILTNPKNQVIGSRAYGSTEEQVSKISTGIVRGHLVSGVQACVKHFPGHGETSTDSHFALPKVDVTLETLREREFRPFVKAFKSRCAMVMTAHILCTQIDPERPATLSHKILSDILRQELRYSRIIISDDMEMKAITDHFGQEDAPRLAIEAGCDILIYRSEARARHAYESLSKDLESGKLSPQVVIQAAQRVKTHKKEVLMPYQQVTIADVATKVGTPEHQAVMQKIESPQKG